jgi:hypothetical protein
VNFDKKARTNDEQWINKGLILRMMEKGLTKGSAVHDPIYLEPHNKVLPYKRTLDSTIIR